MLGKKLKLRENRYKRLKVVRKIVSHLFVYCGTEFFLWIATCILQIKEVINRRGRYVESCFGINFQLKSSCDVAFENGHVVYDLESKNYNDLVEESSMLPNILILLVLPTDSNDWLEVTADQLVMKRCAWWCSLEGQEPTTNQTTKRIFIPDGQIFSPAALIGLMEKVKGGKKL